MNKSCFLYIFSVLMLSSCRNEEVERYVFFLHNRFLETHSVEELHPRFGKVEYAAILDSFREHGLKVISEQRDGNVNARTYAREIVAQIDSLVYNGAKPNEITVVGTSKGGYIAQYVSTLANNPELNFVFIASHQDRDLEEIPEINYCGNILTIYEASDPYGTSAMKRVERSTCDIRHFKELELQTGMGHGFLFKPLREWISPTVKWAKGNYELKYSRPKQDLGELGNAIFSTHKAKNAGNAAD